ncbi:response regulator transcription factor [Pontixanthobacter rizhaonensis]|uniref:response regulator transcription factor n=1 Tax=Pontixanthobacter rizhaonensis TaxID=2730337 RepID=UPI001B8C4E4F|nr:response regulator transcription factor [Pontixanthobacter rizhaonensis]
MPIRVAIADDDQEVISQVEAAIRGAGHECVTYRNGKDVLNAIKRETFDVVLLDWSMPGATGIEVLGWAAENIESPPPFIMLTSRSSKGDIIRGLETGACDYVIKPESSAVILARIEAAARRGKAQVTRERFKEYGIYKIDSLENTFLVNGEEIKLTSKEFQLGALFFENMNRPLSRGYLFSQVWGTSEDIATRTLDMHISRVRSKLSLKPENGFVIQTVFGFGYRMDTYLEVD